MKKQFGTNYGCFILPTDINLNKDSIIYSFGVGEDISFDVSLSKHTDSKIHLFDPTPRAIEHVQFIKNAFETKTKPSYDKRYGGGDINYINMLFENIISPDKLLIFDYGAYNEDTSLKFYEPINKEHVSCSLISKNKSNDYYIVRVKKIKTIMNELNHSHIDLLKLDIEGVECKVLLDMLNDNIFPKYICVEFDSIQQGLENNEVISKCINLLLEKGYTIYNNHNYEITFIRV